MIIILIFEVLIIIFNRKLLNIKLPSFLVEIEILLKNIKP